MMIREVGVDAPYYPSVTFADSSPVKGSSTVTR